MAKLQGAQAFEGLQTHAKSVEQFNIQAKNLASQVITTSLGQEIIEQAITAGFGQEIIVQAITAGFGQAIIVGCF